MEIKYIEAQVIQTAIDRDRRDLCEAAFRFRELLNRHGDDPRVKKSREHIEAALEMMLSVVR